MSLLFHPSAGRRVLRLALIDAVCRRAAELSLARHQWYFRARLKKERVRRWRPPAFVALPSGISEVVMGDDARAKAMAIGCVASAAVLASTLRTGSAVALSLLTAASVAAAWLGGAAAGAVAILTSILLADLFFTTVAARVGIAPWIAFTAAASGAAWIAARQRDQLAAARTQLASAERRLGELERAGRRERWITQTYERLASSVDELAAFVVNGYGLIAAWPPAAERLYGVPAVEALGTGMQRLFGCEEPDLIHRLLGEAARRGSARWSGSQHARGESFDADLEIRSVEPGAAYAVVVRDLRGEHRREDLQAAAAQRERALRADTELMRRQLSALESVTDPGLDASRPGDVELLLETLRVAVDADGVALVIVSPGMRRRAICANGVQPGAPAVRPQPDIRYAASRVLLIQNDAARVAQSSALAWPETVSCLVAVPVAGPGQTRGVLEVVNERPRRATDADMALIRVVASRVAIFGQAYGETGAVA